MYTPTPAVAQQAADAYGTPVFLTDAKTLRTQVQALRAGFTGLPLRIYYAMKANPNPHILRVLRQAGVDGVDAVSPYEVQWARDCGFASEHIIFTGSNPKTAEIQNVHTAGVLQNAGSLSELARLGQHCPGAQVGIRLSPGVGAGECAQVTTGGDDSKFGITTDDITAALEIVQRYDLQLVGIHSHIGSGFYDTAAFAQSVRGVLAVARQLPSIRIVDVGGGFGVAYRPGEADLDIAACGDAIRADVESFVRERGPDVELRIEPGKFLVAGSTVLLTHVTTVKEKAGTTFVGVNTGMQHLVRPAMYGAYHHVVSYEEKTGEPRHVAVVGNACETCDVVNADVVLVDPAEEDLLAIQTAGAYGAAMSSNYNLRPRAAELLHDSGELLLTRRRETYPDLRQPYEYD